MGQDWGSFTLNLSHVVPASAVCWDGTCRYLAYGAILLCEGVSGFWPRDDEGTSTKYPIDVWLRGTWRACVPTKLPFLPWWKTQECCCSALCHWCTQQLQWALTLVTTQAVLYNFVLPTIWCIHEQIVWNKVGKQWEAPRMFSSGADLALLVSCLWWKPLDFISIDIRSRQLICNSRFTSEWQVENPHHAC